MGRDGFVYLLQSEKDGSFYYGSTNDINRRFREHNEGKSASTRWKRPWKLIVAIRLQHISHARKVEQVLKAQHERVTLPWFLQCIAQWENNFER